MQFDHDFVFARVFYRTFEHDLVAIDVQTKLGTFDPAAAELVQDIRSKPAPFTVLVAGQTAAFVDLQPAIGIGIAVLFHVDVVTPHLLAGAAVALAGVVLVQLRRPAPALE